MAPAIRAVLERAIELDDFGYPAVRDQHAVPAAFAERMLQRFGWAADAPRVVVLSDVVQGLYLGLLAFTAPGDGVLIQTPIYPPFLKSVADTGRRTVTSALVDTGTQLGIDFDHLRSVSDGVRVLLLCHPHNPTGRVFTRAELEGLAALAIERDWLVFSDEIHADLTHSEGTFVPFASLGPEVAARTITLTSATKAFNIAGLRCAVAHFGTRALQTRFNHALPEHVRGGIGILGQHCTVAAWQAGRWLAEEVSASLDMQRHGCSASFGRSCRKRRCTCRRPRISGGSTCARSCSSRTPAEFFRRQARVALFDGHFFGDGFEQHARLNFATSPALLGEIIERMARAVRTR